MFKKSIARRVAVAMFMALALTFLSVSPIAQARADINYVVTGISTRSGAATLYGYFINGGSSGGTVTAVRFSGYIGDVRINASAEDMSLWVGADSRVNYTITITSNGLNSRTSTDYSLDTSTVFH